MSPFWFFFSVTKSQVSAENYLNFNRKGHFTIFPLKKIYWNYGIVLNLRWPNGVLEGATFSIVLCKTLAKTSPVQVRLVKSLKCWKIRRLTYRTRANKGRSWIVATPKKIAKIGAFYWILYNLVHWNSMKFWQNAPLWRAEKLIFE